MILKNKSILFKSLTALSIVAIIALGFFVWGNDDDNDIPLIKVEKGEIAETVRITGKVIPSEDVNLAFEVAGKIDGVYADVGDIVIQGQRIISLDTSTLNAELKEAEATLLGDRASLSEVKTGSRPEEVAISESKVKSSESIVFDAEAQLGDKLRDSYTKVDDAIRNKTDQLFTNPTTNPQLVFNISNLSLEQEIKQERLTFNTLLSQFEMKTRLSQDTILETTKDVKAYMYEIDNYLNNIAFAVNGLLPNSSLSQTVIDGYKSDVLTARTNVSTALSSILSAEEKLRSAKTALQIAIQDLALINAGSTEDQIKIAESKVNRGEAMLEKIKVNIQKSTLRSPINGVLTSLPLGVGETVTGGLTIATVMNTENVEIEAYIPEVDIGRVNLQNTVKITIDAFPNNTFEGIVTYIDPAETIIDGVVNFKSKIQFITTPPNIRSGLTSNLFIETSKKTDALILPQYAIIENDNGTFVLQYINGEKKEVPVSLGVRGDGGYVEIVSGLEEGSEVYNVGLKNN